MDSSESLNKSRDPEAHALVRRFSLEVAPKFTYPHAIHAVADHSRHQREIEAAEWRLHFQDPNAARKSNLEKLDVEAKELKRIIKSFPEAGDGDNWGYDQVQVAVTQAQKAYETKSRAFSGKTQKMYHDVMCNLDAHAGVLSIIPQGNTYVSVVTGAVKTLVKASVTHRKTIEDLTRALKEVNDEAHACLRETQLVKSEETQAAVAKFYTATFLFYTDAIRWFQSSSTKKIWHSLDEKFSERFKGPLADIQRLSRLVQRATSRGSGAEIRVTRMVAETTNEDLRAGLEGLARQYAELIESKAQERIRDEKQIALLQRLNDKDEIGAMNQAVWCWVGISGTQLLVGQRRNNQDDQSLQDTQSRSPLVPAATPDGQEEVQGFEDEGRQLTIIDASRFVERLVGSICRGVRVIDVGCLPGLALDQRIAIALERWTLKQDASTLLYLEAAAYSAEARSPQVTVAAARIVEAADQIRLPTLSFFCDYSLSESDPNHLAPDDEEASVSPPLLGLVYSLIFQLTQLLPPLTNIGSLITDSEIASLNASFTSWSLALRILSKLLTVAPSFLLCVVDGFHAFEGSGTDLTPTRELLGVLQKAMEVERKVLKVLFTDSRRAFSLVQTIPMERREIIEGMRRAGSGRASVPAGRTFVDLKTDMMRNSGKTFACGLDADTVEIRDAESGAALQTLRDLASPLIEIAFMLNEHHLASLDDRGTVQVWNVPSRSLLRTFHLDRKVYGDLVAFSPIGQRLASGIWNGNVKVWDTALSSPLSQNLQGSNSNTSMLVFSPNGQTLASLSIDSSIRLWDLATGSLRKRFIAIKYNNSIAFSVDVVKLISLNKQQHILDIWDTESGQSLKGEDRSLIDLADATTRPSYGVGFIDQWVTVNQQRLIRVTPDRRKFSFSTYGTKIAIGSYLGVMTLLDVDLELMRSSIPCPPIAERQPVTICEFYAAVGASGDDGESSNDEDWETVAWDSDSKVDERTTGAIPRRHSI